MLECIDVVKDYSAVRAVDSVNVKIEPGRIYAMLGPNGSGKTTLMKMIVGLIKPTRGEILLDGVPIGRTTKADICYMPTENYFYSYMKVDDVAEFYEDFYKDFDRSVFYTMLDKMDLYFMGKVKEMSTGMLAKLKVAVAMSRNSKIIMLDEPLNGIDLIARDYVTRAILDRINGDKTVIVSSHLVDELDPVVTGALFMKNGKMVLAGDSDVLRRESGKNLVELYRSIYGYSGIDYQDPSLQGTYTQMSPGAGAMYGGQPMYNQNGQLMYGGQPLFDANGNPVYAQPQQMHQPYAQTPTQQAPQGTQPYNGDIYGASPYVQSNVNNENKGGNADA